MTNLENLENLEVAGFSRFMGERWKTWKRWKCIDFQVSVASDSKRARTPARVKGNYCYRSSSYLTGERVPGLRAKNQNGAIRLTAAPFQPFAKREDGVVDAGRAEHDGHAVVIAAGPSGGWRVCLDCPAFIHRIAFCGSTTKTGRGCRIATRPDLGQTTCPAHRKAN